MELANIYYGTRDQALVCNRAALRVHCQNSQWLQAPKTAAVNTPGLSAHHGWEVLLQNDALFVDAFTASSATEAVDYVRLHAAAFALLFRTNFIRRL